MVESALLVPVIVYAIVALLLFKLLGSFLKAFFSALALLIVLLSIGAGLVIMDVRDFKANIVEKPSLFMIADGSKVLSAIEMQSGQKSKVIGEQQLDEYSSFLKASQLKNIAAEKYYKVVVIDAAILSEKESFGNDFKPSGILRTELNGLPYEREAALTAILQDVLEPMFLLGQFKKGIVAVYPQTALFQAIKLMPSSIINSIIRSSPKVAASDA